MTECLSSICPMTECLSSICPICPYLFLDLLNRRSTMLIKMAECLSLICFDLFLICLVRWAESLHWLVWLREFRSAGYHAQL